MRSSYPRLSAGTVAGKSTYRIPHPGPNAKKEISRSARKSDQINGPKRNTLKFAPMTPVGQRPLSLDDFADLLYHRAKLALDETALEKVRTNFTFLSGFSANKLIYGINTGFGPMAQYKVEKENLLQLQYNLIRSHSSGSGNLLPALLSKAA